MVYLALLHLWEQFDGLRVRRLCLGDTRKQSEIGVRNPSRSSRRTTEKCVHDGEKCTACGTCIDRCPTEALAMGDEDVPVLNSDLCIGCGVCATGCAFEAITLVERAGILPPPVDQKALLEAVKASQV